MAATRWTDLLDPSVEEIAQAAGVTFGPHERGLLAATDDPRPALYGMTEHAVGVFVVAVAVPGEDRVYYQEVDTILTADRVVTVRRTPPDGEPYDPADLAAICAERDVPPGRLIFHLLDSIAERYLDLIHALNEEIDEAEDAVESNAGGRDIHARVSHLRHDILHIRRTLSPTRDAVHRIVDGRLEAEAPELMGALEQARFSDVYDKLLRAADGLELSRDLVAGVRDYQQARVAQEQNEIVKRLTVIASLLLLPTFIVGLYGQNFDRLPELHWQYGYEFSWALIIGSTIAQLAFFRWKKWI